jgi:hypothetical protein
MSVMDTMVEDYLNATRSFDSALSPYFQFSQSPCWMWVDGECNSTPKDPNQLAFPHKIYAAGRVPVDPSYAQVAGYFGRIAAYYRSGGFVDECGKTQTSKFTVPVRFWGVGNEGEHLPKDAIQGYTRMYDAILAAIKEHEGGGEQPMKYVAINQNFGGASKQELDSWLGFFLNKSNHADHNVQIDTVAMHAYFHGAGNSAAVRALSPATSPATLRPPSPASAPLSARAPPLCLSNCIMVNETYGGHYIGTWRGASPPVGSLAACNGACLTDATCRQMTWAPANARRPEGACVLYNMVEKQWRQSSSKCQASTKCAAGSPVAEDCAAFPPSPQPPPSPPPPSPGICDAWGLANITEYESVFAPLEEYLNVVDSAIAIVHTLAPSVGIAQGEFGVTLHGDIDSECDQVVATMPTFQLVAAAVMGYGYGSFAARGLDFVLQSQYTGHQAGSPWGNEHGGFPHNYYPSLSMYNWTTGIVQPRAVVIQIINAQLHPGFDRVVLSDYSDGEERSMSMPKSVYTLQFVSQDGRTAKLLLVNKAATAATIPMSTTLKGGSAWVVDETYTTVPSPRHVSNVGESLTLTAFATAIVVGHVQAHFHL